MKKRWRDRLPYGVRKRSRRLIVRLVRAAAPLLRDVLNIAATNGIDVQRELGLTVKTDGTANLNETEIIPSNQAVREPGKPRIVVFDAVLPTPDQDAGSARMFMILKSLAGIGKTIFVPVFGPPGGFHASLLEREGIEIVPRSDFEKQMSEGNYKVAILSRVNVADEMLSSIRRIDRNIRIVFDTVDIHTVRLETEHQVTGNRSAADEARVRRKQERRLARLCDQVWCVTEEDKEVLAREAPGAAIRIIPTIHEIHDPRGLFAEREGLLFIGNFLHRPNKDALDYFVNDIAPLLSRSLPGVKLHVVGSHMSDEIRALASDSVVVLGHVPRVDDLFHRSRLFVAPLRFGSGMNGKIGQALSYSLPIITTTIGAQGFHLRDGHDAMVADEPAAFAAAIAKAYSDEELWQHLSKNGYQQLRRHFTPQIVDKKIVAAIKELG